MDGYHIVKPDGSYGGMDVEYLNALSEYAGWEIEYVACTSWEEALQLLSEKQVDLVGSAQYSYERSLNYQYADLASGYTFGVIAVKSDSKLAYEDFTAMHDTVFGMVKEYVRKEEFLQYLQDNGIKNPNILEYESTAKLYEALEAGEIGAMVHTFTEVREGQRLIGRFAPRPFYYITWQGNHDVMRKLNHAIADLKMNQPQLESDLMNEFYYDRFDKAVLLTTEEKVYITQQKKITVGYLDGFYPFSYEEEGEWKGLSRQLLESSLSASGLELHYEKMENGTAAKEALKEGSIDLLAYNTDTQQVLSEQQLTMAAEYAEIPLVLVMEKSGNLSDIKKLATVSYLEEKAGAAVDLQKMSMLKCETQQEAFVAVKEGRADAVLCDGYLAEHLLRTEVSYGDFRIKNVLSGEYAVSIAIGGPKDSLLAGILGKTIGTVDSKMINEYMLRENTYPLVSFHDFVRNNSFVIILMMFGIIVVVILIANHIISDSKKIQKLMYKDTDINIWNLNYFIFLGEKKLLADGKEKYAVVYINQPRFQRYNMVYGWDAGKRLLECTAQALYEGIDTQREICARNQGDSFVLLLSYADTKSLEQRVRELKKNVEKRILDCTDNRVSMKIGIYYIPQLQNNLRQAISYARQAIEVTGNGSDIEIYDDMLETMLKERHEREKLLESVDINRDFVAYYQPKVDIRNKEIVGAEALVRFVDPTDGGKIKPPGFFVPYYEQTGQITEIDFFVFESICKMLRRRMDEGKRVVPVSCNFSRLHFMRTGFPEHFEEILNKYQVSKEWIEVEITETLVVEELHHQSVKQTLDVLREKGIHISIDDFGAGYSSLGVFEKIPASVIKLDRSFLLNQEDRGRQRKIMRGIVKLTEALEAQIICEGVETEEDVRLMEEIGAYVAQGYFFSKPISEEEFEEKLG